MRLGPDRAIRIGFEKLAAMESLVSEVLRSDLSSLSTNSIVKCRLMENLSNQKDSADAFFIKIADKAKEAIAHREVLIITFIGGGGVIKRKHQVNTS